MEKQTDFLENLDSGQPIAVTKKTSPKQVELDELLKEKDELSRKIDSCPMCDGGNKNHCSKGHPQDWEKLLERIKLLEDSIAAEDI
jgi:hypothetical protein